MEAASGAAIAAALSEEVSAHSLLVRSTSSHIMNFDHSPSPPDGRVKGRMQGSRTMYNPKYAIYPVFDVFFLLFPFHLFFNFPLPS